MAIEIWAKVTVKCVNLWWTQPTWRDFFLAVIMTIVTCALCGSIRPGWRRWISFYQGAYDYLFVIFLEFPFTFFIQCSGRHHPFTGRFQDTVLFSGTVRSDEYFSDMLFIIVFKLGTAGAGWATILSQAISGVLCFSLYEEKKYDILKTNHQERRLDMHYIKILFTMAVLMGLQFSITPLKYSAPECGKYTGSSLCICICGSYKGKTAGDVSIWWICHSQ